jgi:hypothetical protein
MPAVQTKPVDINKFWEKTPTALKYVLVFVIFLTVSYFLVSKNAKDNSVREIATMKKGIDATYTLIGNFEDFRREQDSYNKEILTYLNNLHSLVQELNVNTNRKLDMILSSGGKNANQVIEKILLLNESFEKLQKAYSTNIEAPNLNCAKSPDYNISVRKVVKSDTTKR